MKPSSLLLLFLSIFSVSLLSPPSLTSALTVHLVPHTHDDVGWLKTFEQYYLGLNNSLQQAGVQYILDSTVAALLANPKRKFIYGEQAFFSRWWKYQSEATKASVRRLVAERRLEFVNGGWCMHDEATTHYIDMIDQTTLGHLFILNEFGEAANPRVGWQIDPFGHSATHAALLTAEVGLDATFFSKYDYQDHSIRRSTKELEFIWRPSPALGASAQTWTGTFPGLGDYGPPPFLCFDYFCQSTDDDPVQADRSLEDYNVDFKVQKVDYPSPPPALRVHHCHCPSLTASSLPSSVCVVQFIDYAKEQAAVTKGDFATMQIMWYLGSDFQHEASAECQTRTHTQLPRSHHIHIHRTQGGVREEEE